MNNIEFSIDFFKKLSKDNMQAVDDFYAKNIEFYDPIVTLKGINDLRDYYKKLYDAVITITFEFEGSASNDQIKTSSISSVAEEVFLAWKMKLRATGIKSGEEIIVSGCSHIKFANEGKAIYHRDYYDMGEFVYENILVLKNIIRFVKSKLK